jgi:uncharacterized protein YbjT (DUF2867 family)
MASVLLTGGTGRLGRAAERSLLHNGDRVRILSRGAAPAGRDPDTWATGDLSTGKGLAEALLNIDTIVHLATSGRGDADSAGHLIRAANAAGRPHLIYTSIVGVDRIPLFYYRAKLATEDLVQGSGLPWTILRSTQFHNLVFGLFASQRRLPLVIAPAIRFQPIDVRDVAAQLAGLVQAGPSGRVPDIGGPEMGPAKDFAEIAIEALGSRRRLLSVRLPGKTFAGYRAGHNLAPDNLAGTITFGQFAAEASNRL